MGETLGRMTIRLTIVSMLAAALLGAGARGATAETWTAPGFYTITADGWTRTEDSSPTDASFVCQRCEQKVIITLKYSRRNEPEINEAFKAYFSSDEQRRAFARKYLDGWARSGATYELQGTGLAPLDDLQALQFTARVTLGKTTIDMTHYLAIHKARSLSIAVMATGLMTAQARTAVDGFFAGLKLQK